jgi:hypothetical protein
VPAISVAARGGPRRVAAVAAGALALVLGAAALLGRHPLVTFALAFVGPAIVLPALLLWPRATPGSGPIGALLGLSLAGAVSGLVLGWLIVVFGMRVW